MMSFARSQSHLVLCLLIEKTVILAMSCIVTAHYPVSGSQSQPTYDMALPRSAGYCGVSSDLSTRLMHTDLQYHITSRHRTHHQTVSTTRMCLTFIETEVGHCVHSTCCDPDGRDRAKFKAIEEHVCFDDAGQRVLGDIHDEEGTIEPCIENEDGVYQWWDFPVKHNNHIFLDDDCQEFVHEICCDACRDFYPPEVLAYEAEAYHAARPAGNLVTTAATGSSYLGTEEGAGEVASEGETSYAESQEDQHSEVVTETAGSGGAASSYEGSVAPAQTQEVFTSGPFRGTSVASAQESMERQNAEMPRENEYHDMEWGIMHHAALVAELDARDALEEQNQNVHGDPTLSIPGDIMSDDELAGRDQGLGQANVMRGRLGEAFMPNYHPGPPRGELSLAGMAHDYRRNASPGPTSNDEDALGPPVYSPMTGQEERRAHLPALYWNDMPQPGEPYIDPNLHAHQQAGWHGSAAYLEGPRPRRRGRGRGRG